MKRLPILLLAGLLVAAAATEIAQGQTYFYDAAGRLIRVAYPPGNGVKYEYDAADNMTGVSPLNLPAAPAGLEVARLSGTSSQLTWQDNSNSEQGFVVMRRLKTNYRWIVVANLGPNISIYTDNNLDPSAGYGYRVAAQGSVGLSAYSAEVSSSSNTSIELTLTSGGSGTTSTPGVEANVRAGYAAVTVDFGADPYGTAVFSLVQNGVVVSEAGVPASPPTQGARIFVDYRAAVAAGSGTVEINTGFAVVNRGSDLAAITYTLRDLSGLVLETGMGTLDAGAHFAKFINQMKDIAPDFDLPAGFATNTKFGSLEITSNEPLSILALRLTTNQRNETLLTSTPIADLTGALSTDPLYFPQLVDGGGYVTSIILLNTSNTTESGMLEIFAGDGSPLTVGQEGGSSGSVFNYFIPAGGAEVLQTDGAPSMPQIGWIKLTPNPGTPTPVGAGVFQFSPEGTLVTESGIPSAIPTTRARIYVDKSEGHDTGLAIANPGDSSLSVSLESFETDGGTPAGTSLGPLNLSAKGHRAAFVGQLISGLPQGFTGVLEISSSKPFVALTLRSLSNGRGDFLLTTFPIADLNRPAPAPIVFPQIADGGGFVTQFILISPSGSASTTINFFGDDGSPLPIAKN